MANYVSITSDKSKKTAFFLCLVGGIIGLHRFYVGKNITGLIYLFTLGGFLIGWIRDLHKIFHGKFTDNVGMPLRK